jgi:hypothetical protein
VCNGCAAECSENLTHCVTHSLVCHCADSLTLEFAIVNTPGVTVLEFETIEIRHAWATMVYSLVGEIREQTSTLMQQSNEEPIAHPKAPYVHL